MKKTLIAAFVVIILWLAAYFSKSYWMQYVISDVEVWCIAITTPNADATVSFPLTVSGTLEYGCRPIFEADAGFAVIQQDDQAITTLSADNGLMMVSGEYYQESDYPITRTTTIQNLSGTYTGPAELVLSPSSPCGESPDCPVLPEPISISINLP